MARKPNPKIDPDAPASLVAALWKTNSAFARAIGKTPSTTQVWLEAGAIPPAYHADIIAAAKRDRKNLKPDHFVDRRLFRSVAPAAALEAPAA